MGYVIFQKHIRKRPKQTGSQSAVRGVSTHDVEERAFSEQPTEHRNIEMADKKQEENVCRAIRQEAGPV